VIARGVKVVATILVLAAVPVALAGRALVVLVAAAGAAVRVGGQKGGRVREEEEEEEMEVPTHPFLNFKYKMCDSTGTVLYGTVPYITRYGIRALIYIH
jgi:hypothetical protein